MQRLQEARDEERVGAGLVVDEVGEGGGLWGGGVDGVLHKRGDVVSRQGGEGDAGDGQARLALGFDDLESLSTDGLWRPLRERARFREILDRIEASASQPE